MKTTREYVTTTQDGRELRFVGTYVSRVEESDDLDGMLPFVVEAHIDYLGSLLVVYIDGQEYDRSEYPESWKVLQSYIFGMPKIGAFDITFGSQEKVDAYNAFLADLMQDDEKVKAFKAAKAAE